MQKSELGNRSRFGNLYSLVPLEYRTMDQVQNPSNAECHNLRHDCLGFTIIMDSLVSVWQHRFSSAADRFDPIAFYTNLKQTYFELYL
jgi:hypothetical protein